MTEGVIAAVIAAIATIVAAWISSRLRSRVESPTTLDSAKSTPARPVPRLVALKAHDGRFVAAD
jgi:hypothetical protein